MVNPLVLAAITTIFVWLICRFTWTYNQLLATKSANMLLNAAGPAPADLKMLLFTAPGSVANTDVVGTLTELTAGAATGYARQTITGASWVVGAPVAGVVTAVGPAVTFTFTASTSPTVVGAAIVDNAGTVLLFDAILDTAFTIPPGGGSITITPTVQFKTC
jgi:hypothetical protein